jgi:hypothetical protein
MALVIKFNYAARFKEQLGIDAKKVSLAHPGCTD